MEIKGKYYGFVYIWRDHFRKKFCIGSHMGTLEDGYTSSTGHFRRAYTKRPADFKRKILFFLEENDRTKLLKEETRWLSMIKIEELGVKYYNTKRVGAGGNLIESFDTERMAEYRKKLKGAANRSGAHYRARSVFCAGKIYETATDACEALGFNPQSRLYSRRYEDFYFVDEGPLTINEIAKNAERREMNRIKGIKARGDALRNMSKRKRKEKARKAHITKKKTCPHVGSLISEGLRKAPGKTNFSIDGKIFNKLRIACEEFGIPRHTLTMRLDSDKWPTWVRL
jgi:hypothetical protein